MLTQNSKAENQSCTEIKMEWLETKWGKYVNRKTMEKVETELVT